MGVEDGSFGPAVIISVLREAGVDFGCVGFVTAYALEVDRRQRTDDRPRSDAENKDRLARALRELGAVTDNQPFIGDGTALASGRHEFRTQHGEVWVNTRTATSGRHAFAEGVRIQIYIPTEELKAYEATGKYPGLADVV